MKRRVYSVLSAISSSYPHLKGRLPTCSSPVRHSRREASSSLAVRLACLRRAASVRSEPGSNSPLFYFKHPEGRLISIIFKQVPFLIFRNVDLERKKITTQSNHPSPCVISSLILCSTLIFLTKDDCSLAFFFPFPLISKTSLLAPTLCLSAPQRKRIYHKIIYSVKRILLFSFVFLI